LTITGTTGYPIRHTLRVGPIPETLSEPCAGKQPAETGKNRDTQRVPQVLPRSLVRRISPDILRASRDGFSSSSLARCSLEIVGGDRGHSHFHSVLLLHYAHKPLHDLVYLEGLQMREGCRLEGRMACTVLPHHSDQCPLVLFSNHSTFD